MEASTGFQTEHRKLRKWKTNTGPLDSLNNTKAHINIFFKHLHMLNPLNETLGKYKTSRDCEILSTLDQPMQHLVRFYSICQRYS